MKTLTGLIIIGGVIWGIGKMGDIPNSSSRAATAAQAKKGEVTLHNVKWNISGFGTVGMANFTVKNGTNTAVKDIKIRCNYFGESGTKIDRNTKTVYKSVAANGRAHFEDVNMGFINSQAATSSCEVLDWTAGAFDPNYKARVVQKMLGITVDGQVGPATLKRMKAYCATNDIVETSCNIHRLHLMASN